MAVEELRGLFEYNRWATLRILGAVDTLTPEQYVRDMGSSFPSVRDTLVHVMSAENVWLARWQGHSPTAMPPEWRELSQAALHTAWAGVHTAIDEFVGALRATDLERDVAYTNLAGQPFVSRLGDMMRHVVNHSTYHRGQVTTMLRQLGAAAPPTDLIAWYRQTGPQPGVLNA